MSELHKFIFDGLPVRGILVRLTDAWTEILNRRASNSQTGAYPQPVQQLLGELLAAAALMQSSIKFDGALVVQIFGDGPVKLAVAEVRADLSLRATATVIGAIPDEAQLSAMVNVRNLGRCAITLDPQTRFPGQQPYQGVVPLFGDRGEKLEELLALDVETILRRLFWDEKLTRFAPQAGATGPRFACSCSREKVGAMIVGLGADEAQSIIAERGQIEVACEFCGLQYRFDTIDAAQLFRPVSERAPGSSTPQ